MTIGDFSFELNIELITNILGFWSKKMIDPRGGFYGRMDADGHIVADAPKGNILNARILWTFSAAYRVIGGTMYKETAALAYKQIVEHFIDKEYGGTFWSLDAEGKVLDSKKQFYAIAFSIYGLSEYYRATGCEQALELAIGLYRDIEEHSRDMQRGGYIEACTVDWKPIADMRLSDKDRNDSKTMNTHLHILEAYTNLYRVWPDEGLRDRLNDLINIFLEKIIQADGHLGLFFNDDWELQSSVQSFGHDIEASWLLLEAINVCNRGEGRNDEWKASFGGSIRHHERSEVISAISKIALAALEGWSASGGLIYEYDPVNGEYDKDRHWWVQAEMVVGCYYQYLLTGSNDWLERAYNEWEFIKKNLIRPDGEWYWSVKEDGSINNIDDIAGFWKCPYHNGRMCLALIEEIIN